SASRGYTKIPAKAVIGLGWKCFRILYAQFLGGQSSPWHVLYAQLATIPSDKDIYTLSFTASTGCSLHGVPIVVRAQTPRHYNACRGCGRFYANLCAIPSPDDDPALWRGTDSRTPPRGLTHSWQRHR